MVVVIAVVIVAEEMPLGPDVCSLIYATACRECEIVRSLVLLLIAGSITWATSGHQKGKQARQGKQAGYRTQHIDLHCTVAAKAASLAIMHNYCRRNTAAALILTCLNTGL